MAAMTRQDYETTLRAAHMLRELARRIPHLDEAIEACDCSDAIAPMLDPTLYRARAAAMHEDRDTLAAVAALARLGATERQAA